MVCEYPPNTPGKIDRPARYPVLMIPQNILALAEETECGRGMGLGLEQRNSTKSTEESATGQHRSYKCLKTIDSALAVLAKAREFSDPQTLSPRERRSTAPRPPRPPSLRDSNRQEFHPHNNNNNKKQQQ